MIKTYTSLETVQREIKYAKYVRIAYFRRDVHDLWHAWGRRSVELGSCEIIVLGVIKMSEYVPIYLMWYLKRDGKLDHAQRKFGLTVRTV